MKTTVVHCKREPCNEYIGRPSKWGNPFKIGTDGDRDQVIALFRQWVLTSNDSEAIWIRQNIGRLQGKRLGCWCKPKACHGDVLAELADEEPLTETGDLPDGHNQWGI